MADALASILRLRRAAADAARRSLAEAMRQESEALAARAALQEILAREVACAAADSVHPAGQIFAAWLQPSLQTIEAANRACLRAAADREISRQDLASRQAELRAATLLQEERAAAARKNIARKDQKRLDEFR